MRLPQLIFGLALVIVVIASPSARLGDRAIAQEWPTPPPAPKSLPPIIDTNIIPVNVPLVDGATRWDVQPLPQGRIPLVPPVAKDLFEVPGQLTLVIQAGTLDRTIQLTYVPVDVAATPAAQPFQSVVKAFDLESFDHNAVKNDPPVRRPWLIEVPVASLQTTIPDTTRLTFARLTNGKWEPLITTYHRHGNTISARILGPGNFGILLEQLPV